jgi:hypothetical protein
VEFMTYELAQGGFSLSTLVFLVTSILPVLRTHIFLTQMLCTCSKREHYELRVIADSIQSFL